MTRFVTSEDGPFVAIERQVKGNDEYLKNIGGWAQEESPSTYRMVDNLFQSTNGFSGIDTTFASVQEGL